MSQEPVGITKEELSRWLQTAGLQLIDVRLNWAESELKIVSAVHEDPRQTAAWAGKYRPDQTLVLYCSSPGETVSGAVAAELRGRGFTDVRVLRGGWIMWTAAGLPTQRRVKAPTPTGVVKKILSP